MSRSHSPSLSGKYFASQLTAETPMSRWKLAQGIARVPKKLPIYIRLMFMLLMANVVLIMVLWVLARNVPVPEDPFSSVVFPGQLNSSVIEEEFSCPPTSNPLGIKYCFIEPETGPFFRIGIGLEFGAVNREVYYLREGTLRFGDLILLWGSPHVLGARETRVLVWPIGNGAEPTVLHTESQIYLLPVHSVWFSTSRKPEAITVQSSS